MPKQSKQEKDTDSSYREDHEATSADRSFLSGMSRGAFKPEKGAIRKTKVRKVGRSSGVILGKDVLDHYKLQEGDEIHVVEEQDGIKLVPYDPSFDEQMEAYRKGARKFRNALRELSK